MNTKRHATQITCSKHAYVLKKQMITKLLVLGSVSEMKCRLCGGDLKPGMVIFTRTNSRTAIKIYHAECARKVGEIIPPIITV